MQVAELFCSVAFFILWAHFAPWVLSWCCLADALDRRQPPDVRHCRRRASPQIDSTAALLTLRLTSVRFSGPSPVLARFLLRICLVSAIRPLQKQKIGHFCDFFSIRDPFPLWQGESEPLRDWRTALLRRDLRWRSHATAPNRKKVAIQTDFLFSGSRSGPVNQIRRETHNAISLFVFYFAFFGPILL